MEKENRQKPACAGRKNISRKEALTKAGKYAAFTAASMLVILNPKEAQAESPMGSPAPPPGWES